MMINITGTEPIYEAQRFLRALHFEINRDIPMVSPDGVYGDRTVEAVKKFQQLYGLPITGEIDYDTWKMLYSVYLNSLVISDRPNPVYLFPESCSYVTHLGERSDIVALIQFMLKALACEHRELSGTSPTGVYDEQTIEDVSHFQKIYNISESGMVDRNTWNYLANAYSRELQFNE
ncbi:MAG: peptidoglycan-binding protein [Clostridiales bacterium]|nr:peptidoglycan-binding protein [Clostridiales bacterium]